MAKTLQEIQIAFEQLISQEAKSDAHAVEVATVVMQWMNCHVQLGQYNEAIQVGERFIALAIPDVSVPIFGQIYYQVAILQLEQAGKVLFAEDRARALEKELVQDEKANTITLSDGEDLSFPFVLPRLQRTYAGFFTSLRTQAEEAAEKVKQDKAVFDVKTLLSALMFLQKALDLNFAPANELLANMIIYREEEFCSEHLVIPVITENKYLCLALEYAIKQDLFVLKVSQLSRKQLPAELQSRLEQVLQRRYQKTISTGNITEFYYLLDDRGFPLHIDMPVNCDLRNFICAQQIPEEKAFISALITRGYSMTNNDFTLQNSEAAVVNELNIIQEKNIIKIITGYMGIDSQQGTNALFWKKSRKRKQAQDEGACKEEKLEKNEDAVIDLEQADTQVQSNSQLQQF